MQFGPDGYLYIAVGDGGANPPSIPIGVYGQTLDDLLGSILRIDPRAGDPYSIPADNPFASTPAARPEIAAYGLRNPWRFWIDAQTNTMLIGDVGEGSREEIDRLPLSNLGLNFGWPCKEGTITPDVLIPTSCSTAKLTAPLYEYSHSETRCSITGGVVSRDPRLPTLNGLYLWSDLCDDAALCDRPGRRDDHRATARPPSQTADQLRHRRPQPKLPHNRRRRRLPSRPGTELAAAQRRWSRGVVDPPPFSAGRSAGGNGVRERFPPRPTARR